MDKKDPLPGLIEEEFISLFPSLAIRAGVNRALILQKLHYLLAITEKAKNLANFIEGRWWVYNTYEQWQSEHFPWLSVATVKRLFLDLEHQGIIRSITLPTDSQLKYYTLLREAWPAWFAQESDQNDPPTRIKMIRPSDQKDLEPGSKRDGSADQNDPTPGSKESDLHLYKESVTTSNLPSEITTTTGDHTDTGQPPAQAVVVDGAGDSETDQAAWDFIRADIAALNLSAEMEIALFALGPAPALAIALAASKPNVKSPGGLAVSLIRDPDNIAPALLDRAVEQLVRFAAQEARAPEPTLEERQRDYEQLQGDARRILDERAQDDFPGVQEAKNDSVSNLEQPSDETDNGLDFTAGGLTIAEAWTMTLLNMQSQMGRETFNCYYAGTEARSFRDGVLTLAPKNVMGHDMLARYRRGWELEVSKLAGTPVQIEVAEVQAV